MQEIKKLERKTPEVNCLECGKELVGLQKKFCCSKHKNKYNHKHLYNYKYTRKYYSQSPRHFFMSTLQKKKKKREEISLDFLTALWDKQKGLCALTGEPMTIIRGEGRVMTNVSIDRIDSSKEYTEDNIQLVCLIVNLMKQQLTVKELIQWCKKVVDYEEQQSKEQQPLKPFHAK